MTINGYPFYGMTALMRAAKAEHAEPIHLGSLRRSIVLVYPGVPNANMTWAQVKAELKSARDDPRRHEQRRKGRRPRGEEVRVKPEKPFDLGIRLDAPTLETVPIPAPDALVHGGVYFKAIERAGFHGGLLNGLRDYYR